MSRILNRGAMIRIAGMSHERQRDAIAQWRETGRLPRRGSSKNKGFSVPADPRSFAAQLLRKRGAARGREYLSAVRHVFAKEDS